MKILFNHNDKGQEEIKKLLGFLDADVKFEYLETDIELNTPYLVQFIGQAMYDKLITHYEAAGEDVTLDEILKNAQLYVLLMAYLEYASNGDIVHGNSGRKIHFAENEKTPWDWQIEMDNGALKRRAYRALDRLIEALDKADLTEWTSSDQYKQARSLFLYDTSQFNKVFPINNSGQLYYRLVPFMGDIETEKISPVLGSVKFQDLKTKVKGTPTPEEKELILYCQKITAYRVLERASTLLPDEMFEEKINYKQSYQDRELIREKRQAKFAEMAHDYEGELARILARQNAKAYELNPTHGIQADKKHVNL